VKLQVKNGGPSGAHLKHDYPSRSPDTGARKSGHSATEEERKRALSSVTKSGGKRYPTAPLPRPATGLRRAKKGTVICSDTPT
jgi:hypothetical protein